MSRMVTPLRPTTRDKLSIKQQLNQELVGEKEAFYSHVDRFTMNSDQPEYVEQIARAILRNALKRP